MTSANPNPVDRRALRWWWLAAGVILGVFATTLYFGRYSPEARAARRFLREMPVAEIQEITIEPYTVLSLTDHAIVIRDPDRIGRIATVFREAVSVSPNHPHARWVAIVRFHLKDRDYGGQVEATTNDQGGLFWFSSNVRGGWNYGSYRNDQLGPLFEQLVADEKAHPKP